MITLAELTDKTALKILDFFSNNFSSFNNEHYVLDESLSAEFENIYLQAASGAYDHWLDYKQETLALIIILTQLPRLLYANSPTAYDTDNDALEIAKYALNQKADYFLKNKMEKIFLYLPFMRSEKLEDQEISIKKFASINKIMFEMANFHYQTILKFKRFPSRNIILNRENTPEEIAFLAKTSKVYFTYL